MSVDIFGSDNKTNVSRLQLASLQSDVNSKFVTLAKNLQTKLDRNVVSDLVTNVIDPLKDYVDKLNDKIGTHEGELLDDLHANDHKICNVANPTDQGDAANKNYVDLMYMLQADVCSKRIQAAISPLINVANPTDNGDAANKSYVDLMYMQQTDACNKRIRDAVLPSVKSQYILSTIGLIPPLFNNKDKSGYVVTASSELNEQNACHKIFNPRNAMWRANENAFNDMWVSIQCIKPTRVYMFTIAPADKTTLIRWKIQGKNLNTDWIDLPFNSNPISSFTRFETDPKFVAQYENYRLYIRGTESENNNPGISHWQLFTVDYLQ